MRRLDQLESQLKLLKEDYKGKWPTTEKYLQQTLSLVYLIQGEKRKKK